MGQAEFVSWCAYFAVEGWPGWRADLRTADLLALLANVNRDAKKQREPFKPADFVRDWWGERKPVAAVEPKSLLAKFRMLTERVGVVDG